MTTQPVQIGYGKANFSTSSITIAGFVVEPDFVRTLASKKLGKAGRTLATPVSDYPDIDGWLFSDQISAPEGTIFLIQASVKFRAVGIRDGGIFIRSRTEGKGLLITASIPHDAKCTLNSHNHVVFSGYGDVLTAEDLEAEGLDIPKNYRNAFMNEEEVEECFNVQVLRNAIAAAPSIETHVAEDGSKVVLKVEKGVRRMRIRRS